MLSHPSEAASANFPHLAPYKANNHLPSGIRLQQHHHDNNCNEGGGEPTVASEQEDTELEAAFRALHLSSLEEALASLNHEPHSDVTSSSSSRSTKSSSSSSSTSSPPTSPTFSNSDSPTPPNVSSESRSSATNGASPKRTRRVLSQLDVNELIQMKISQLESASFTEEDEEKAIAKQMKKIHKEISQVISGQEDQLAKVNFMQRKYLEMFQDMRKQERDHAKLKKKFELLQREKDLLSREKDRLQRTNDSLTVEHGQLLEERHADKITINKSDNLCRKLEGLCRQIHRENKHIKGAYRSDRNAGMTMGPGMTMRHEMIENHRPNFGSDTMLQEQLCGFMEQYDLREQHFNSVVKSKDLEQQLVQAKLDRQKQIAQQETAKVDLLKSQLNAFSKTEAELRKQLNVYVDKFKQVEETLNKSNSLFQTFRKEMEAMSKKGSSLEKVNLAIRAKCDTMNHNILEMAEERTKHQSVLDAANKKQVKLETLCRALQAERTVLRKHLDIYEALYPGIATAAAPTMATQNGGGGENGVQADTVFRAAAAAAGGGDSAGNVIARAFVQTSLGDGTDSSLSTGGPILSIQSGVFKQGKVGSRRVSITSGKTRQKQKHQHLQILLQRGEQLTSSLTVSSQPTGECAQGASGGGEVFEDHHIVFDSGVQCNCHLSTTTAMNPAEQNISGSTTFQGSLATLQETLSKLQEHSAALKKTNIPRTSDTGETLSAVDSSVQRTEQQRTVEMNGAKGGKGGGVGGVKGNKKLKLNEAVKQEQKSRKDTHPAPKSATPTLPKTVASTGSPKSISPTPSKLSPGSTKTPLSLVSSTSLGAISRQAQGQEGYQTIRIPGLYPSAITIK
ncbi:hypothetical protein BGX23_008210 [Mortierella sp. AD031]|nr:hypothetical protein BGX23_008210 [Mortierella sp. AD031]